MTNIVPTLDYKHNNIAKILKEKGFGSFTPTADLLETLGMNKSRFWRLCRCESYLRPLETKAFANWLGVTENEITEPETES